MGRPVPAFEETEQPEYIICDGWAVLGPSGQQSQHAVTLVTDNNGIQWADFECGVGNSGKNKALGRGPMGRILHAVSDLHEYCSTDTLPDRRFCEHYWCRERRKDWQEHSEVWKARRAEEAERIRLQMPATREALIKLERRLART